MKNGFDNDKYLKIQSEEIKKRIAMFDSKLYLEFGGKLFDDYHASRVLPGFEANSKIKILQELKDDLEVVFCINAKDIEKKKIRADYGITYDKELLRLIENLKALDIYVSSVVITLYKGQTSVKSFRKMLERMNVKTYIHTATKGYPTEIETIVSSEGYGLNEYIETTKKLVVVTAPGPSSGKLATCLSQLYHEYKRGVNAGYAKYETFPVWNLPLTHPVNIAYEAATADIQDINMIDPFHLEAYGVSAVNYNRDIATFPILKNILLKITGKEIYKSPTDMGVNTLKDCIIDDEVVKEASKQEIIRRYYAALCDVKLEKLEEDTASRIKMLMNELDISEKDRDVVLPALKKAEKENTHVISLKLPNGKIITGKQTDLLSPASSAILNAVKELTNIPDEVYLLSPAVLEPILKLKDITIYQKLTNLNLQEVLIALSICSVTNPIIVKAIDNLSKLKNTDAHASYMVSDEEIKIFKRLQINLTCEPKF
ncbi:MAG: DUF1846 domain-containing protein [Clostridia bacterium]